MGKEFHRRFSWKTSAFQKRVGEDNKQSKLTERAVLAIRAEYDSGQRGVERAAAYGITAIYYNAIGRRKRWRHLL